MNSILVKVKSLYEILLLPLGCVALALIFLNAVAFLPFNQVDELKNIGYESLCAVIFPYFIASYLCKNNKKAMVVTFCVFLLNICCQQVLEWNLSIFLIVLYGYLLSYFVKELKITYGTLCMIAVTVVVFFAIVLLYKPSEYVILQIADKIKGNGVLFSIFSSVFDLIFNANYENLFYYNDYSSAQLLNDNIVSGAINIFEKSNFSESEVVKRFLTGKYFVNIFVSLGMFFYLVKKADKIAADCLVFTTLLSLIFGINELLIIYIIFYNPLIYVGYLLMCVLSYLLPIMLDLSIGFLNKASLIELIMYGNKWAYLILVGLLISFITYVIDMIIDAKYDFRNSRILPKEIKNLVDALGGEENIEKLSDNKLYVKNPNLIDIIKVDCEIHQNEITLLYDDFDLLKQYL